MSTLKDQISELLEIYEQIKKDDVHYTLQDYGGIEIYQYSPAYEKFQSTFRTSDLKIDFDWMGWAKEANAYIDKPEKIDKASLKIIRQLLSAHMKNEAMTDGHLAQIVDNGHLFKLLDRLQQLNAE